MRSTQIILIFLLLPLASFAQEWKSYYDSTELYWQNDWQKCIELLEKSLPILEKSLGKNHPNYLVVLNDLSLSYHFHGALPKAEELFLETLKLKETALGEENLDYAATLLNLSLIYQEQNRLVEADSLYDKVLKSYYANYDVQDPEIAKIFIYKGKLYQSAGNFTEAEISFKKAHNIYANTYGKTSSYFAGTLNNLGQLHEATGDYPMANELLQKAADINKKVYGEEHAETAAAYERLAVLLDEMGDYAQAETHFLKAANIQDALNGKDRLKLASTYNNLAGLYLKTGNLEKAKLNFDRSIPIYAAFAGTKHQEYATAISNYASYFIATNNLDSARILYLNADDIYKQTVGKQHQLYANNLVNLAGLYRKTGEYSASEKRYLEALSLEAQRNGKSQPTYAIALNNLGTLYTAMGKMEEAIAFYESSLEIKLATLGNRHPSVATSYNNLAVLHLLNKRYDLAEPLLVMGIQHQLEQIRTFFPSMSEKEKKDFYTTIRGDVERFNSVVLERYDHNPALAGEMYNNQLATKALLFQAGDKMRANISNSGDAQLISSYNLWRKEKEKLGKLYALSKSELEKQQVDISILEEKVNAFEKELSAKSLLFAKQAKQATTTWQDIQSQLKPGEAAIEMVRFRAFNIAANFDSLSQQSTTQYGFSDQIYYAALILTSETTVHPKLIYLNNGQDLEQKYISYYKNALQYRLKDVISYTAFWENIQEQLTGIHQLYFSPDGVYNNISLNMLQHPKTQTYLMDGMKIQQVTSTKDILPSKQSKVASQGVFVLGDPLFDTDSLTLEANVLASNAEGHLASAPRTNIAALPGTRTEAIAVHQALNSKGLTGELKLGAEATESALKGANNPKILHIATHGFFSDTLFIEKNALSADNPLFQSGLLLAGAGNTRTSSLATQEEDGILTAYEAMNMNLDATELVVLSACETGISDIENSAGVHGLQRAFQIAGAKSIIISLWTVDDIATQTLMTLFYNEWMKTGNKRTAFANAQSVLRESHPHPYYWAAFVMIGE